MKRMEEELRKKIETARKKLDKAIADGCDEAIIYRISVELDHLIERYITLEENAEISVS